MHYVKRMLKYNCYADLHPLFTQAHRPDKEITESYAAFYHMSKVTLLDDALNLHIGDGVSCRTGAVFTFLSKSKNISIDPMIMTELMDKWIKNKNVHNFNYYNKKWEKYFQEDFDKSSKDYNITLVHSHTNIYDIDQKFPNWRFMYSNPCCIFHEQVFHARYMYENNIRCLMAGVDRDILSEKNQFFLYEKSHKSE